jgi:hypothetical protein
MKNLFFLFAFLSTTSFAWTPSWLPAIGLNKMTSKEVPNLLLTEKNKSVSEVTFLKSGRGLYKMNAGASEFRWIKERNLLTLTDFSNDLSKSTFYHFNNRQYFVTETIQKIEYTVYRLKLVSKITYSREMVSDPYDQDALDAYNDPAFEKTFTKEFIISKANPKFLKDNLKLNTKKNLVLKLNPEDYSLSTLKVDTAEGNVELVGSESFEDVSQGSAFEYKAKAEGFELKFENGDLYDVNFLSMENSGLYRKALIKKTTSTNEYVYLSDVAVYNRPYTLMKSDIVGSLYFDDEDETEFKFYDNNTAELVWIDEENDRIAIPFYWELKNNTLQMTRYFEHQGGMVDSIQGINECLNGTRQCTAFQKREYNLIGDQNGELLFIRYLQMNNEAFYPNEEFNPLWEVDRNKSGTTLFVFKK